MEKLYIIVSNIGKETSGYAGVEDYVLGLGESERLCDGVWFVKSENFDVMRVCNELKECMPGGRATFFAAAVDQDDMYGFMPARKWMWMTRVHAEKTQHGKRNRVLKSAFGKKQ